MSVCGASCSVTCRSARQFAARVVPTLATVSTSVAPVRSAQFTRYVAKNAGLFGVFGSSRSPKSSGSQSLTTQALMGGTELAPKEAPAGKKLATFAGGCFWGLELAFQRVPGVEQTSVGYTQGKVPSPAYELVCTGLTGHTEAVQVVYDPSECTFESLCDTFFEKTDPTTLNRQGGDMGTQYRSGIYYHDDDQKAGAMKACEGVQKKIDDGIYKGAGGNKVVVEVLPAGDYYLAEEYHQQYLEKGGRFNRPQSAAKGCKDTIRCYG